MPQRTATAVTAIRMKISQEGKRRATEKGCKPGTVKFITRLRNHQAEQNLTKGHERLSRKKDIGNLVVMNDFLE